MFNLKSRLRSSIRRVWSWSPMRRDALNRARVARGRYKCAGCKETSFGPKDIAVDHIIPATPPEGLKNWDEFIERLFCPSTGLQILCKPCHKVKTKEENEVRKIAKRKR